MIGRRRMRIVPWLSKNKQEWRATLIIEYLDGPFDSGSEVVSEISYEMTAEQFDELKEAVFEADNSEL